MAGIVRTTIGKKGGSSRKKTKKQSNPYARVIRCNRSVAEGNAAVQPARVQNVSSSVGRKQCGIYVLELEGGFVYVGKSTDVTQRMQQHMHSNSQVFVKGASFTRLHRPTGRLLKRLGTLDGNQPG